jgi:hypothetical protein
MPRSLVSIASLVDLILKHTTVPSLPGIVQGSVELRVCPARVNGPPPRVERRRSAGAYPASQHSRI